MRYFVSNESILHDHYDNLYIYLNSNTSIYKWRVEKIRNLKQSTLDSWFYKQNKHN